MLHTLFICRDLTQTSWDGRRKDLTRWVVRFRQGGLLGFRQGGLLDLDKVSCWAQARWIVEFRQSELLGLNNMGCCV